MQFKEMELKNFRLFRYKQLLKFEVKKNKPLTIIRAENRTGKTTLLTALQWCLFGNVVMEKMLQKLTEGDLLVSDAALQEAKPGDTVKTEVLVRFEHDGWEYIARRVRETQRGDSVIQSHPVGSDKFTILKQDSTGTKEVPNPTDLIQQIVPENLRELFLFDGDRINRFMEPDHEESVQKAVSDMLEFELFDEAHRHLKAILDGYSAELRAVVSGESKAYREKLELIETAITKAEEEISRIEKELRAEELMQDQIAIEISKEPGDAGTIQKQINRLNDQIRTLEKSKTSRAVELGRQIGQGVYFTISPIMTDARDILAQKKKAGEIPKRIGEDLIKERLELGMCICGRPLKPGEPAHKHLSDLLVEHKDRAAFDDLATDILYYLKTFARRSKKDLFQQLDQVLLQRADCAETIKSISQQVHELEQQLGKIDVDAITRKRSALAEARKRTQSLMLLKSENMQEMTRLEKEKVEIKKNIEQAEKRDKRNKELRVREKLTEACLKALTITYHNVREKEREDISEQTQNNFFKMNIRKDEFARVEVTPSFRLQVITPEGFIANPVLSGAQRRALSLAFLFALMQVSERDVPVVVDTPLGMTSGPMRRSITQAMVDQAKQLILLLTRQEIQGVEDILKAKAANQITLSCSLDYPEELVHPRKESGKYTEACKCGIEEQCSICERTKAVVSPAR